VIYALKGARAKRALKIHVVKGGGRRGELRSPAKLKYFFDEGNLKYILSLKMSMSVITFCSKKEDYRSLSNFWEGLVVIDGERVYESGEHAFHGEKYWELGEYCVEDDRKKKLKEYSRKFLKEVGCFKSSLDAKRGGGKKGLKLNEEELRVWSNICIGVQRKICKYKLENYEVVRNDLMRSMGSTLIHSAMRCSDEKVMERLWEGRWVVRDGVGMVWGGNKLGECWMELRV
jgi:predicted NAD-dependent protein-ADP-ribosyltransferase YbiA (DUF1768 family)